MRLFGVWVRNCNQRCWSCRGKPFIYDPNLESSLSESLLCSPLSLQGQNRTPSLQPSLLARHPSFNDGMQWSVQCQRFSLNNITTWPQRGDESRYQPHIQLLAPFLQSWNCSCSGHIGYRINSKYQGWVVSFFIWEHNSIGHSRGKNWKENGIKANNTGKYPENPAEHWGVKWCLAIR